MTPSIASMRALIERHWRSNRVPVGDATAALIRDLAQETGGGILTVPSGAECLTWIVPPKWTVREAWCETLAGQRIADFAWNPLYLKSYSAPFRGVVSREELLAHLRSDPARPERVLYDYRSQYLHGPRTEWGFSLPHRVVESLTESEYRVLIDAEFGEGEMPVLDWTLPGERPETIFVAAHSCHPALVNDGLACIAVAAELFRSLQNRDRRRFTWRLIVGPEYFAAAAFLQHARNIEHLRGGFFLDMLGNGEPLGFSRSWRGDRYIDAATRNVLRSHVPGTFETGYRGLWGNDEMFYDGPDFELPTIGLGRNKWPHYHTDFDDLDHCDFPQLAESLATLQRIAEVFETDCVVTRRFRGPLYQNRFGLHIDIRQDRAGYFALQDIQRLMDGSRSCLEIAEQLGVDFGFVKGYADALVERGLADVAPLPPEKL